MLNRANKYAGCLLIALIAFIFIWTYGLKVIKYPPFSIHQWRQSDCLAYAKTYYQKGTGLFSPSTYNLVGTDGRVVSEFPIIYYIAAQLARLFGFHYFLLRGLTFLCYLLGLFYLYKCIRLWMKPSLLSIVPVAILGSTPFYYYYALNYLPNVPAISLSFGGLFYLLSYERSSKLKHLVWSTVLFLLATLLKPTDGGLLWASGLGVLFFRFAGRKINSPVAISIAISALVVIGVALGWYRFCDAYNNANGNHMNLQSIYPMWELKYTDIEYVWNERIHDFWASSYQDRIVLSFLALLSIIYVVRFNKMDRFLRLFTLFTFLGTIVYDVLWFRAFEDHDYYQLVNVIPCIFVFITVIEWYVNRVEDKAHPAIRWGVTALFCIMAAISISHNKTVQHERYTKRKFRYPVLEIYDAEPFLRSLGIRPSDAIVSVPDVSPNITLAAFGTQGYTECSNTETYNINTFRKNGAKYLIINDTAYLRKPLYEPYTHKLIGVFRDRIYVYDIR